MNTTTAPRRVRGGGRAARQAKRAASDHKMLPGLINRLPNCNVMDEEQVRRLDDASMSILEDVGVVFRDDIALEDWRKAGAKVVGETVYLDREQVRELISTIPSDFTYHARNPANNIPLGGNRSMFIPMTGAPFLRDLDDAEMTEYRRPFLNRQDRWPTLTWPRQIPVGGDPADVSALVADYAAWMAENDLPKLFVNAEPGAILIGKPREACRAWKNQQEVTVRGSHFIQEDSGAEIGRAIASWFIETGA